MVKKILLVLVVLILVGAGYLYYAFGSLLKRGVEVAGSSVLGTSVTVDSVSVSPLSGSGGMRGLRIANPAGFTTDYAMELENLDVSINVGSITSDVIEINHILVSNPHIIYETRITTDNIRTLIAGIRGGGESSAGDGDTGKRVIIREFEMLNPQVTLAAAGAAVPIPLPDIRLTDIGDQQTSVTIADAARQILSAINRELVRANLPNLESIRERARDELEAVVEEAIDVNVEELRDSLRGLL